jgi:ribonuclease P protein component
MRFRPEQHLRRQNDIRVVREDGRREDCRAYTLWWRRREPGLLTPEQPRVGVVASTAAVGGAVQRARAKRRLREVFRAHQAQLPSDCDILMIARKSVIQWEFPQLERVFVDACRRIGSARSHV